MIGLEHYLILAALVFMIGLLGMVLNRNNLISLLMCAELMLIAININLVAFSYFTKSMIGQVWVFFILAVAAAEAAIGLAIFIVLYRQHATIQTESFHQLTG